MTLKHGKFLITSEDILAYLGLPNDSLVEYKYSDEVVEGVEVYVVSNESNELLVDKTSSKSFLRRNPIRLIK